MKSVMDSIRLNASNIIEDNFRHLKDVKIIYTIGASHLLGMRFTKYVSEEIKKFAEK